MKEFSTSRHGPLGTLRATILPGVPALNRYYSVAMLTSKVSVIFIAIALCATFAASQLSEDSSVDDELLSEFDGDSPEIRDLPC